MPCIFIAQFPSKTLSLIIFTRESCYRETIELLASELLSDGELAVMGGGFRFLGMAPRDLLSRGT